VRAGHDRIPVVARRAAPNDRYVEHRSVLWGLEASVTDPSHQGRHSGAAGTTLGGRSGDVDQGERAGPEPRKNSLPPSRTNAGDEGEVELSESVCPRNVIARALTGLERQFGPGRTGHLCAASSRGVR
jgi:hypothetical protein